MTQAILEDQEKEKEVYEFLEDDDTIVFKGIARERNFKIGFGSCSGRIIE